MEELDTIADAALQRSHQATGLAAAKPEPVVSRLSGDIEPSQEEMLDGASSTPLLDEALSTPLLDSEARAPRTFPL